MKTRRISKSDWTKVSVMMRTSVTLQQEKATHFESPSLLFIDLKRLILFICSKTGNKLADSLKTNIFLNLASQ